MAIIKYYKKSFGSKFANMKGYKAARRARRGAIRRGPRIRNIVNMGSGFPKKLMFTHTYCETVNLPSGAAGALSTYQWKANGMFDPNFTGGGHQPYYFDQISPLYDHYCVVGSRINVKFTPIAANSVPAIIGCYINDDTTVSTTTVALQENKLAKWKVTAFNEQQTHEFTLNWSAKKFFGKGVLANTDLQATAGTDPNELSVYSVFIDASTQVTAVTYQITATISYIVVWKELHEVAAS